MGVYVALLRAVNVGGRSIAMAHLRAWLAELRFEEPRTLLQSGNLVFETGRAMPDELERLLEREAAARLQLATDIFVRTAREWKRLIGDNPFRREAEHDPAHLLVLCLKGAPSAEAARALSAAISGPETVHIAGTHAYAVYPAGIGRSKLTLAVIEKHLRTRATGRNWNTVLKIGASAGAF